MKLFTVLIFCSLQFFNFYAASETSISKKKCNDYMKKLSPISDVFNENDEDAELKEFPFMARIENGSHYGNGILISENFVLTVTSLDIYGKKYVILGDLKMGTEEDDAHSQRFDIIETFIHPQFSSDLTFDLTLLKLNHSVKFNDYIRPACLPQNESTISQQLMEIGWSDTNIRRNNRLHKVKLNYVTNAKCKEDLKFIAHQKEYMKNIDRGTILCAITKEGDRDMCAGFHGAALLNNDRRISTLREVMGITTSNTGCSDTWPTVFVRISPSLGWIESVVWPNEIVETKTSTTKKIKVTTEASLTLTNKIEISTTEAPITKTIEATTTQVSSTKTPAAGGKCSFELNNVLIIITILSLILCVLVIGFRMIKWRHQRKADFSVHYRL